MAKGIVIYGTQTGTSEDIANRIRSAMPDLIQTVLPIYDATPEVFAEHDLLVLGGSTWGNGELTFDWQDFWPKLDNIDFTGKRIALFGLGDQEGYSFHFVSAMKPIYDKVLERGGTIIASRVPTDGFKFDHSDSVIDGHFIGLAIDEDNQPESSQQRIDAWAQLVRQELGS